jgi:hypothetical protein
MTLNDFPPEYAPFNAVEICGNRFLNGKALFTIDDSVPLLIGNGTTPRVWLYIPISPSGNDWRQLVRDNRSLHPKVSTTIEKGKVSIRAEGKLVLEGTKADENTLQILSIDLRPFGMNIYSEKGELVAISTRLSGNLFRNINVMVAIGRKPRKLK